VDFIIVTLLNGHRGRLNVANIRDYEPIEPTEPDGQPTTRITVHASVDFAGGAQLYETVTETPEQIDEMIAALGGLIAYSADGVVMVHSSAPA
jgi:hypothetical protein